MAGVWVRLSGAISLLSSLPIRMRHSLLLGLGLAVYSSALCAQNPTFRYGLPEGFLSAPGQYLAGGGVSYVFDRPDFAYQEVHSSWTGGGQKILLGVGFRRGWGQEDIPANTARTADVTFTVGTGDRATFAKTSFAGNYSNNSATVVFPKAQVSMPDWRTRPAVAPAPFDVVFPFKVPYVYDGKSDFVWQIAYENCSESARTRYFCDRANTQKYLYSNGIPIGTGCTATGRTVAHGLTSRLYNYGPNGASYKMRLYLQATNNPSSAPVAAAVGGVQLNLPLPGWCTNLVTLPLLYLPIGTSSSTGSLATRYYDSPYVASAVGTSLYVQAYSPDAGHPSGLSLTEGEKTTMPPTINFTPTASFKYIYRSAPTSTSLSGPFTAGSVITGWY